MFVFLLQLKEDIQVRSNEAQREARKKEKIEKELKQAKNDLEAKTAELKTKQGNLQRAQEDIGKLEQQLKEQRVCFLIIHVLHCIQVQDCRGSNPIIVYIKMHIFVSSSHALLLNLVWTIYKNIKEIHVQFLCLLL